MSLQIWLPLNGNLNNNGCCGYDVTMTTTPSYIDNGKIGKAISTGAFKLSANQIEKIFNNKEISIAFWVYPHTNTGSGILFGNNDMDSNGGRKFSIFLYPTVNDLHLSWQNETNRGPFVNDIWAGLFPSNTWTHCCVTYKNPKVSIYINGVLYTTFSGVSNSSSFAYDTMILNNADNRYVNDLRVYDHCLSPREVKEVSKGLVLHYPLNDICETRSINKYGGEYFRGNSSFSTFTKTKRSDEDGYNYTLSFTGTGDDHWASIQFPTFSFTAGKTYDYSCKVRVNSCTSNLDLRFRTARMSNDWEQQRATVVSSGLADTQWHEYHAQITLQATSIRNGTEYTTSPLVEFYTINLNMSGATYSANFDIKDVCVSECNFSAPISRSEWKDGIVYDTSGLNNNGIIITAPQLSNNSPRNRYCYNFPTGVEHIKAPRPLPTNPTEITVAFWIKPDSSNGGYSIVTSNYNNPGSGFWIATNTEGQGLWCYISGLYIRYGSLLSNDIWYHVALTYNGSSYQWYLNGNAVTTTLSTTIKPFTLTDYIGIGNNYSGTSWNTKRYGCMSDFRIYATALSANDIKELYNTPVTITNNGTLITQSEVIEN